MWKIGRCLLLQHLHEAKMSQSELASRVNVSRQRINDYAHDRYIMSIDVAYNISKALGLESIDSLYEWYR